MFLPDIAWPGRIPSEGSEPVSGDRMNFTPAQVRERAELAATAALTTGVRRSTAVTQDAAPASLNTLAGSAARGRHAGPAAVEASPAPVSPPGGRHRKFTRGRQAAAHPQLSGIDA